MWSSYQRCPTGMTVSCVRDLRKEIQSRNGHPEKAASSATTAQRTSPGARSLFTNEGKVRTTCEPGTNRQTCTCPPNPSSTSACGTPQAWSTRIIVERRWTSRLLNRLCVNEVAAEGWARLSMCLMLFAFTACGDRTPATVPAVRMSADILASGGLSAIVDPGVPISSASGRERFVRDENASRRDTRRELTQAQATQLASRWISRFASFQQRFLELHAGAKVDVTKLTPCRTTRYASGPYDAAEAEHAPAHVRARFGGLWIVPVCENGQLRAMISIAADAHPDAIPFTKSGRISRLRGTDVEWAGISETNGRWLIDEPETAAKFVATQTGAKVRATPRLVVLPRSGALRPLWQVAVDRASMVVNSDDGQTEIDSVFYVGGRSDDTQLVPVGGALFLGTADDAKQPRGARVHIGRPPQSFRRDYSQTLEVRPVTHVNNRKVGELR